MSKCPNGHPTPTGFMVGQQIRCPITKDGINCDAVYTIEADYGKPFAVSSPAPGSPAIRRIG